MIRVLYALPPLGRALLLGVQILWIDMQLSWNRLLLLWYVR